MDFITLDFETATSAGNSPCEIGLTFVRNGKIEGTYGRLIRPPGNRFDFWNIKVHGIRPEEVENEPEFAEVWEEIRPMIDNQFLIAHNAAFDFSVLKKSLDYNRLDYPELTYACSVQMCRKIWTDLPKYNLKFLSDLLGINLHHHRAEGDSLATAQICLKAFQDAGIESPEEIASKIQSSLRVFGEPVIPSLRSQMRAQFKKNKTEPILTEIYRRPDHVFYGKKVVFTGTLSAMNRLEALQHMLNLGGIPEESISPETDFLIIGKERKLRNGKISVSHKQRKAIELIALGCHIKVVSESEFYEYLST